MNGWAGVCTCWLSDFTALTLRELRGKAWTRNWAHCWGVFLFGSRVRELKTSWKNVACFYHESLQALDRTVMHVFQFTVKYLEGLLWILLPDFLSKVYMSMKLEECPSPTSPVSLAWHIKLTFLRAADTAILFVLCKALSLSLLREASSMYWQLQSGKSTLVCPVPEYLDKTFCLETRPGPHLVRLWSEE